MVNNISIILHVYIIVTCILAIYHIIQRSKDPRNSTEVDHYGKGLHHNVLLLFHKNM